MQVLIQMIGDKEIMYLNILLFPIIQLLIEERDLLRQQLILGQRGQPIELKLEEVEERKHVLMLMRELYVLRLGLKLHLFGLQLGVGLRASPLFSLFLQHYK